MSKKEKYLLLHLVFVLIFTSTHDTRLKALAYLHSKLATKVWKGYSDILQPKK